MRKVKTLICGSDTSEHREKELLKIQQHREGVIQNPATQRRSYSKSSNTEKEFGSDMERRLPRGREREKEGEGGTRWDKKKIKREREE